MSVTFKFLPRKELYPMLHTCMQMRHGYRIVRYVDDLRERGTFTARDAVNQRAVGQIEICDGFWPYVKHARTDGSGKSAASYVEMVRQFLGTRKCVNLTFNPADEQLAMPMF